MKNLSFLIFLSLPMLFFSQNKKGLDFETETHDFGIIDSKNKAKIIAKFFFTNSANSPVEILKIHGQNRCIEIDSSSIKKYKPKEKGIITISYNTDCHGPIRKTLSVLTSHKNNLTPLKLRGEIID